MAIGLALMSSASRYADSCLLKDSYLILAVGARKSPSILQNLKMHG